MSRREAPPMKLTVDNGRLVPASAWDQERLLSYRNKSVVNAYVTQEKPRWMERKYWAILDRVVTTCGVAQRTAEDLHDHIKLKLGFVNAKFDDSGKLKVTLKSTKLMDDPEYDGFFKEAMGFLFDLTGVDPMTLKKESADVGEEQSEPTRPAAANDAGSPTNLPDDVSHAPSGDSSGADQHPDPDSVGAAAANSDGVYDTGNPASAPDESGGAAPDLSTAAPDQSHAKATEDNASTTALEGSAGPGVASRLDAGRTASGAGVTKSDASASESSGEEEKAADGCDGAVSPSAAELSEEDRTWLRDGARMLLATLPSPDDREARDVLTRAVFGIRENTAATISVAARDKLREVAEHCMAVCKGEIDLNVPLVAKTALATVTEITPAPVKTARAK